MYEPIHFQEHDKTIIEELIRSHPLGLLISNGANGIVVNPIPFLLDPEAGPNGSLRCHIARPNTQWNDIIERANVVVVFQPP